MSRLNRLLSVYSVLSFVLRGFSVTAKEINNESVEGFWQSRCAKCSDKKNSTDCNTEMCSAWKLWHPSHTAHCQENYVCQLDVTNTDTKNQTKAKLFACKGSCPSKTSCILDSKYCLNHPTDFPCKSGAFGWDGRRDNVYTCQGALSKPTT